MGSEPRTALDALRAAADDGRLDDLCRRHEVRILTVFGSTAREALGLAGSGGAGGSAGSPPPPPCDLDVAVRFEPGHRRDLLALLDELSRLTGSDDIDLLVLDDAGPVARERALVGCLALYESESGAYANAQMAAMCERMDTDWLRRLDLQAMAE